MVLRLVNANTYRLKKAIDDSHSSVPVEDDNSLHYWQLSSLVVTENFYGRSHCSRWRQKRQSMLLDIVSTQKHPKRIRCCSCNRSRSRWGWTKYRLLRWYVCLPGRAVSIGYLVHPTRQASSLSSLFLTYITTIRGWRHTHLQIIMVLLPKNGEYRPLKWPQNYGRIIQVPAKCHRKKTRLPWHFKFDVLEWNEWNEWNLRLHGTSR